MRLERITLNEERNVTLTVMLQEEGSSSFVEKRPAVIVIPGGAYEYCSDREADPVAFRFFAAGYQTFILRYSVAEHKTWPNPLTDYETAIGLIRERSAEWRVFPDKIAVCGFSAGGHLAGAAATVSLNRPNAAILGYAVTNEYIRTCNPDGPNLCEEVDELTPPCFLFATRTDDVVPVMNTLELTEALVEQGISAECHIYSYGPHGFSTADSSVHDSRTPISIRVKNWITDALSWLKEVFGDFGEFSMTAPTLMTSMNGNREPFLSEHCSIGYLLKNAEARAIVKPILDSINVGSDHDLSDNDYEIIRFMKLGDALRFSPEIEEAVISETDEKLRKIRNTR